MATHPNSRAARNPAQTGAQARRREHRSSPHAAPSGSGHPDLNQDLHPAQALQQHGLQPASRGTSATAAADKQHSPTPGCMGRSAARAEACLCGRRRCVQAYSGSQLLGAPAAAPAWKRMLTDPLNNAAMEPAQQGPPRRRAGGLARLGSRPELLGTCWRRRRRWQRCDGCPAPFRRHAV